MSWPASIIHPGRVSRTPHRDQNRSSAVVVVVVVAVVADRVFAGTSSAAAAVGTFVDALGPTALRPMHPTHSQRSPPPLLVLV